MNTRKLKPTPLEVALNAAKVGFETALGQIYIDSNSASKETVFVAGSGRGGTTWIAELINFDNSYRFIFEPLRIRPLYQPFAGRRYLRPENQDPTLVKLMTIVVNGQLRNPLSDRYNRQPLPRKRLVKDVASNLLLGWFHSRFPEIPLILVIRHPCAVASSRVRLGWPNGLGCFLRQETLMSDFLSPFRTDMEQAATPFERHLIYWCIETLIPLRQFKPGQVHLAFFEDFCANPQKELARLFAFLGKPIDERVFNVVDRPSSQAWRLGPKFPPRVALIHNWREHVSDQELTTAQSWLRKFGLDSLYREDGMPNVEVANSALAG